MFSFKITLYTLIFLALSCEQRFKLMGMLCNRCERSQRWKTHLCPNIHSIIEEIIEESCNLVVGHSDNNHFEVVKQNNYCVSLLSHVCSVVGGKSMAYHESMHVRQ